MSLLTMCNRCGKILGEGDVSYRFDCQTVTVRERDIKEHTLIYKDFCGDCMNKILAFMINEEEE